MKSRKTIAVRKNHHGYIVILEKCFGIDAPMSQEEAGQLARTLRAQNGNCDILYETERPYLRLEKMTVK